MAEPCFWAEESSLQVFAAQRHSIGMYTGGEFGPLPSEVPEGLELVLTPISITDEIVQICWAANRLVVASFDGEISQITLSVPGYPGFVSIEEDWFEIPSLVTGLEAFGTNVLITCDNAIYLYDIASESLRKKLDFGTPAGKPISRNTPDSALIWTNRGVVAFPEFKLLTRETFFVPPGETCTTSVIQYGGVECLIVSTDGLNYNYNVT